MDDIVEIPFAPGYGVDAEGNVYSRRKCGPGSSLATEWKLRKPSFDKDGYRRITLHCDGKPTYHRVCRIVARCFIGEPEQGLVVNHIDCNNQNDHASNLEWVTPSVNSTLAALNGLYRPLRGESNGMCKITRDIVDAIRSTTDMSQHQMSKKFGISQASISNIITRKSWK